MSESSPLSNVGIINEFRESWGIGYESRIPEATQANLEQTLENLLTFPNIWNDFQHYLINRVGSVMIRTKLWGNPLAFLKTGTMRYGATIEEVHANLIKAREWNADRESLEKDVWGQERLDIRTAFHTRNRTDKYKITLSDAELRLAVVNEGELAKLVALQMGAMQNSDQWDEFLIMCRLFEEFDRKGGFYKVNVSDVGAKGSDAAVARELLRAMRAEAGEMEFYNTKYNFMKMPNFAKPEELMFFMTPKVKAALDVEALAAAFNLDKLELKGRIILLPADHFKVKGVQAIVTTKYFFVIHDTLIENRSIQNPDGLYTNFWLHHHGIYSLSLFENAVMFTTEPGTEDEPVEHIATAITDIKVLGGEGNTVTEVVRGEVYALTADVTVTPVDDSGLGASVKWAVSGADGQRTRTNNIGMLHVDHNEASDSIVIKATAVNYADGATPPTLSETLTVTGERFEVWPVAGETEEP